MLRLFLKSLQDDIVQVGRYVLRHCPRPLRLQSTDRSLNGFPRVVSRIVSPLAGQKLIEYGSERIDVGSGRKSLASSLLRAGVTRRHQPYAGIEQRPCEVRSRVEQLGDAEIQ